MLINIQIGVVIVLCLRRHLVNRWWLTDDSEQIDNKASTFQQVNNKLLRVVIRSSMEGKFQTNPDGRIKYRNPYTDTIV
jgi:hypothetical protein